MLSSEEIVAIVQEIQTEFHRIELPEAAQRNICQVYGVLGWKAATGEDAPALIKQEASRQGRKLRKKPGQWTQRQRYFLIFGLCWGRALQAKGRLSQDDEDRLSFLLKTLVHTISPAPSLRRTKETYTEAEVQRLLNPLPQNAC